MRLSLGSFWILMVLSITGRVALPQPPGTTNEGPGGGTSRSLDDLRELLRSERNQSKGSTPVGPMGGMGMSSRMGGGMGSGMPGMGLGAGMPGMGGGAGMPGMGSGGGMGSGPGMGMPGMGIGAGDGGGMEGNPMSDEKSLQVQVIQQLRSKLNSKRHKRDEVELQLRKALQDYFQYDMIERVKEFDKVKARVLEMESKLQRRLDRENEIIELQLKQMIYKADGLDFFVPTSQAAEGDGMGAGGMGMGPGGMGMGIGQGGMGMGGPSYGEGSSMGGDGYGSDGGGGEGYGGIEDAGMGLGKIGYDALIQSTRVHRPSLALMDETDPLKNYFQRNSDRDEKEPKRDKDKMQRILLGFHEFEAIFGHFPNTANRHIMKQPPHSWRVAILPLIGRVDLFNEYNFDEPWDSENNSRLLNKMPDLFSSSGSKANHTPFVGIDCEGAIFSPSSPTCFAHITDGTSNTIVLVKAKNEHAIPWTKPEDLSYTAGSSLNELGSERLVGLADGTLKTLDENAKTSEIQALISRGGGEVIPIDAIMKPVK